MAEGGKCKQLLARDHTEHVLLRSDYSESDYGKDGVNIDMVKSVGNTAGPDTACPDTAGPTLQAPTLHAPTLHAPTLQAPTLHAPTLQAPTLHTAGPDTAGPDLDVSSVADSALCMDTNLDVSTDSADQKPTTSTSDEDVIPDYVQPPTVFEVSFEGGEFSIKDLNFTIIVHQGAVPRGVKISFRLGVCLGSEESVYPVGLTPVSPVFLLQMTEGFKLLEDVDIFLPHFLSDPAKVDEMGVMKAPHDKPGPPNFTKLPCKVTPVDGKKIATFSVRHFCYLQLYAKAKSEEALKFRYCICPVLPQYPNMPLDTPFFLYFCLTYSDPTFLMALESQCETIPKLKNHQFINEKKIEFSATHSLRFSTVKFEVNKPQRNSGWEWDVYTAPDMPLHPSNHYLDDFKYLANSFDYPPSYKLEVCPSGMKTAGDTVLVSFQNCSARKIAVPLPPYTPGPPEPEQHYCPEYTVFKECSAVLISIIETVLSTFRDALWSEHLIPRSVLDYTRDRAYSDREKAQKLVYTIADSIEHEPSKYYHFITVLEEDEQWAATADVIRKLHKCYRKLKGEYISEVVDAHKTTLVVEINPIIVKTVICYLFGLGILNSEAEKSAQDIITLLSRKLKCKPWLFKDACTALCQGGLNKETIKTIKDTVCKRFPNALEDTQAPSL